MSRTFFAGYLALGLLYQYWVYGDASVLAISTLVHVLFWFVILLATSFWYILLVALICLVVAFVYFITRNHRVFREVYARRNNPASVQGPEFSHEP